jgi:hypothetical protein
MMNREVEMLHSKFEVQDDNMIKSMHNINIMFFSDEIIQTNKQAGQIVPLRNTVRGPIEPTVTQLESWAVSDNGASEAFNKYEANDIWMQHGSDPRVNTCRRMIWLRRVGMFLDYKIAHSKESRYMQPSRRSSNTKTSWILSISLRLEKLRQ